MPYQATRPLSSRCLSSLAVDQRRSQTRGVPKSRSLKRRKQARIPDPARPPKLVRCQAVLRHQFGVSGSWIEKKGFRWTCADRMMLLLSLFFIGSLICCLFFDLASRSSHSSLFAALLSKLCTGTLSTASHFVIPHFPTPYIS